MAIKHKNFNVNWCCISLFSVLQIKAKEEEEEEEEEEKKSGNPTDPTILGPTLKCFGTSENYSSIFMVF